MDYKIIKAIVWRDLRALAHRKRHLTVSVLLTMPSVVLFGIANLFLASKGEGINVALIDKLSIFIGITGGYFTLVSLVRFWQTKAQGTLLSLMTLPVSIKLILFSKCIVPVLVGGIIGIIFCFGFRLLAWSLGGFPMNPISFIYFTVLFLVFGLSFSIINGYTMWCLNVTYAKAMQYLSMFLFMGFAGALFTSNMFRSVLIFSISLAGLAIISLFLATEEKVMQNLYE